VLAVIEHPFGEHGGSISVFGIPRQVVQREKGVSVSGNAVAEAVSFAQDAAAPYDFAAVESVTQVFLIVEDSIGKDEGINDAGGAVTPMDQLVLVAAFQ